AIAQRLARRLCKPGEEAPVDDSTRRMFDKEFESLPAEYHEYIPPFEKIYHPLPAPGCASGTKGRVAVMEVLEVDAEIQNLILHGGSEADMYKAARQKGFMSMKEDAII